MEHDDYLLDSFSSSMIQELNEILIDKNFISHSFRKCSVKNEKDVEFSCILKSVIDSSSEDKFTYFPIKSFCLTEEELNRLKLVSQSWCLHLTDTFIKESSLHLKLNRPQAFFAVINLILSKKSDFGRHASHNQIIRVTWENGGNSASDLTSYRLSLLKKSVENCLDMAGYLLDFSGDTTSHKWIHFSTKCSGGGIVVSDSDSNTRIQPKTVLCGPVLNGKSGTKENVVTAEEYRRLRFNDLQIISENKNFEEMTAKTLAEASVKLTLLQTKATQPVSVDFAKNRETGSKGGTFLLYNLSRLRAIREKHQRGVQDGLYPALGSPDQADFSVLTQFEEWTLLFNHLLEYPSLVKNCARDITEGRPAIHKICKFLFSLCSLFSVYYRKVRILLEPKDHLLPLLKARLFFVMSVEQVLDNGLRMLDVETVQAM